MDHARLTGLQNPVGQPLINIDQLHLLKSSKIAILVTFFVEIWSVVAVMWLPKIGTTLMQLPRPINSEQPFPGLTVLMPLGIEVVTYVVFLNPMRTFFKFQRTDANSHMSVAFRGMESPATNAALQ